MDKKSWNLIIDCMNFIYHNIGDKAELVGRIEERKQELNQEDQDNRVTFELLDGILVDMIIINSIRKKRHEEVEKGDKFENKKLLISREEIKVNV